MKTLKHKLCLLLLAAILALPSQGCASGLLLLFNLPEGDCYPMGGTLVDGIAFIEIVTQETKLEWYISLIALVDLPFSFALDVITLPLSLTCLGVNWYSDSSIDHPLR